MKEIANDLENISGTSNYEANRPLPTGKNKKAIGLMKRWIKRKNYEFVPLRPKTYLT